LKIFLPAALALAVLLWSRSSGGAAAVDVPSDPFASLSEVLDQGFAAVVGWDLPARGEPYRAAIDAAEIAHGIPHNLLGRVLYQESRFRPDIISGAVRSSAGAMGIAQFMPATAAEFGIDPLDPSVAIDAAGQYLAQLFSRFGSWSLALAAYNWGLGNVSKYGLDGAPEKTRDYVAQITADVAVA